MNRGSTRSSRRAARAYCRFNEAPIHESGKWGKNRIGRPENSSFNEAPIHESGKWVFPLRSALRVLRFNEAPIHESGKYTPL